MLRRWRVGVVISVLVVALASACANDEDGPGGLPPLSVEEPAETEVDAVSESGDEDVPATTAQDPATTESSEVGESADSDQTVLMPGDDGFDEYIADRVELFYEQLHVALRAPSADPESDFPSLAEVSAEEQLDVVYDVLKERHEQNRVNREPGDAEVGPSADEEHRISPVISIEGDAVTVYDCFVDDDDLVDRDTGEIQVAGTLTVLSVTELKLLDGSWKVTHTEESQKIQGVGGCFLSSEAEFPY